LDLLVGGTPCQAFSVAGLRKGLEDPRGNLALTYVAILNKFRPKWCIWENVPGVLSSNGGRDFSAFLTALGELGYGWAYRVLDAQNFGVAQRRRRVFVVGCLGGWESAAKVLFESESLSGNNQKGRRKKEEITSSIRKSIAYGGSNPECADTVTSKWAKGSGGPSGNECGLFVAHKVYENHPSDSRVKEMGEVCQTVTGTWGMGGGNIPFVQKTYSMQGNLIGRDKGGPNGVGVSDNNTMYTLTKTDVHAISTNMAVRRLTEVECERLQGFPDNYTNIKENCPSGSRYKALGNSMAVPVMKWIGNRINDYERGNL
jgi:DNA (cytosine-5)-methyltransferase 1